MRPFLFLLALLVAAAAALATVQEGAGAPEMPEPAQPKEQHAWLKQLVGDWRCTATMSMGPGGEPMTMESTETVRAIGDLWIQGEGEADFGDMAFTSQMTLGYDPAKGRFVGTWIDSMQPNLWVYDGELDAARKKLTLTTKGPAHDGSGGTAVYRDAIELVDEDHKRLTSSAKGEDGSWTTFLTAEYTRVK